MTQDRIIAKALCQAIQHVRRIASRDHIKANRIERVEQFVTSLRRSISQSGLDDFTKSQLSNSLTNKAVWHDYGVPHVGARLGSYSSEQLKGWLREAEIEARSTEGVSYDIETDLDHLQQEMEGFRVINQRVTRLAEEGEELLDQLTKVFTE